MIIETPSRLHMGLIDLSRKFERQYGALGVMVKGGFKIEVEQIAEGLKVDGTEREKHEVSEVYERMKDHYDIDSGFRVDVERRVPRHVGLGSTTQLYLGTAKGMAELSGIDADSVEIASVVGRSRFSAIGTYGFDMGGFILEGGKKKKEKVPPLCARMAIPDDWRFLIVNPKEEEGYDETEEKPIMKKIEVDEEYPQKISHHIIMGVLPSIKDGNIGEFADHISAIQRLVGMSFSEYQGGIFHPAVSDVIEFLEKITSGAGQSSWGPTAYGILHKDDVEVAMKKVEKWLEKRGEEAYVWSAEPDNSGAEIID